MADLSSLPPSKKRAAGREISRDNPGLDDDEDVSEQETGTFKRASDEVIASRKIVKVRRQPASSAPSAPASNPFAGIRLVPPVPTTAVDESKKELQAQAQVQVEEKAVEKEDKKDEPDNKNDQEHKLNEEELEEKNDKTVNESSADKNTTREGTPVDKSEPEQRLVKEAEEVIAEKNENTVNGEKKDDDNEKKEEGNPYSSFQQLSSSKNAFTGLAGTGFSTSTFSFGAISKDGSPSGSTFAFGSKTDQPSLPSFGFAASNNGSTPLFGASGASGDKTEGAAFPSMQEVSVETGEENEETVFTADSALFEYSEGGWKERGKGEVKINVSTSGDKKARLVMRARGNYRLILNAYLYPDMKLTKMDKKGITFACANSASEGKTGLATFALKFKEVSIVETFSATVAAHKGDETGEPTPALKTPENSPKAAEV